MHLAEQIGTHSGPLMCSHSRGKIRVLMLSFDVNVIVMKSNARSTYVRYTVERAYPTHPRVLVGPGSAFEPKDKNAKWHMTLSTLQPSIGLATVRALALRATATSHLPSIPIKGNLHHPRPSCAGHAPCRSGTTTHTSPVLARV